MPLLSADPKGYYALLGLDSKADRMAVKAAYRRRAKALHPDVNRRSDAIETFRRLTEAYRTLADAERRPAYDAGANGPGWYESDGRPSPLHCSACGRLTAQPRYVVFERVTGQIFRTKIARIQGIFCRDCAQKQSIKASSATWALGWWSPTGPARTLKALWSNLKGGLLPKAENARLLIHQARAFLARGEADIARSLVVQARPFAAATAQMGEVEDLWRALAPGTRKLRNRWRLCSRAFALQLLPLAGLAVVLTVAGLIALVRLEADSAAADIKVMPVLQGETRYVAADDLKVREGASHATPMVALLDRFSQVTVTETDGEWVRIVTPQGIAGHVLGRYLFAGTGGTAHQQWCAEQKGDIPGNGLILARRAGGEHRLMVRSMLNRDALVRLKTQQGKTLLSFYVAAGQETVINGIPGGTYRAVFATGIDYSRACGIFLKDMHTYIVPQAQTFRASLRTQDGQLLVLPQPGDGPGQSHIIAPEFFQD